MHYCLRGLCRFHTAQLKHSNIPSTWLSLSRTIMVRFLSGTAAALSNHQFYCKVPKHDETTLRWFAICQIYGKKFWTRIKQLYKDVLSWGWIFCRSNGISHKLWIPRRGQIRGIKAKLYWLCDGLVTQRLCSSATTATTLRNHCWSICSGTPLQRGASKVFFSLFLSNALPFHPLSRYLTQDIHKWQDTFLEHPWTESFSVFSENKFCKDNVTLRNVKFLTLTKRHSKCHGKKLSRIHRRQNKGQFLDASRWEIGQIILWTSIFTYRPLSKRSKRPQGMYRRTLRGCLEAETPQKGLIHSLTLLWMLVHETQTLEFSLFWYQPYKASFHVRGVRCAEVIWWIPVGRFLPVARIVNQQVLRKTSYPKRVVSAMGISYKG